MSQALKIHLKSLLHIHQDRV